MHPASIHLLDQVTPFHQPVPSPDWHNTVHTQQSTNILTTLALDMISSMHYQCIQLGLEGYSGSNFWNPILVQALHTPQRTDSYMRHISNYRARWTESVTTEVYSETTNIQWAPKTPIWYKQNDGTTWNHHTVGSIPMKYWFLYLGKSLWRGTTWIKYSVGSTPMTHRFLYQGWTLWRDHMKSSFCREYSDATLSFTLKTNNLMRPHGTKDWEPQLKAISVNCHSYQ